VTFASPQPLWWLALGLMLLGTVSLWLPRTWWWAGAVMLAAGTVADATFIVLRAVGVGRPPVMGTFENTLVAAGAIALVALACALAGPFAGRPQLARLLAPWAFSTLAYGLFFRSQPMALEASGRSLLGYAHAFVGWLDLAVLLAATSAALATAVAKDSDGLWDEAHARLLGIGFALLTVTMATGALLSLLLFSEWFRWQVVESFAAAAWIAYALVLHARLMFGWRGRRLALATLAVLPVVIAAFWIWSVYPDTYHYFERAVAMR